MLKHLTKRRDSDRFRGFSYRKTLRDVTNRKGVTTSKVIAWEISYENEYLTTLDTLKEVTYYIETKAKQCY